MQKFYIALFLTLNAITFSIAQNLQSPKDFLGYELGTQFSRHHQVVDYFKHVASQMPSQVKLEKYEKPMNEDLYMSLMFHLKKTSKILKP